MTTLTSPAPDSQDYLDTQQILSRMTVDRLKRAIRGLNSSLHMHMRVSGKKNDLVSFSVPRSA